MNPVNPLMMAAAPLAPPNSLRRTDSFKHPIASGQMMVTLQPKTRNDDKNPERVSPLRGSVWKGKGYDRKIRNSKNHRGRRKSVSSCTARNRFHGGADPGRAGGGKHPVPHPAEKEQCSEAIQTECSAPRRPTADRPRRTGRNGNGHLCDGVILGSGRPVRDRQRRHPYPGGLYRRKNEGSDIHQPRRPQRIDPDRI